MTYMTYMIYMYADKQMKRTTMNLQCLSHFIPRFTAL